MLAHWTGHDLRTLSALFDYLDVDRAMALPAAIAVAGWTPLPYGQLGQGPKMPSLEPILNLEGVVLELLDKKIDGIFHLDSASPPMLLQGEYAGVLREGMLRPLVHGCFASMVMYHDERRLASMGCLSLVT